MLVYAEKVELCATRRERNSLTTAAIDDTLRGLEMDTKICLENSYICLFVMQRK